MANKKLIFLMGLPASGKTTLGKLLASSISERSVSVIHLDADALIENKISPSLEDFSLSGRAKRDGVTNKVANVAKDSPQTIAQASGCTKYVSGLL